MASLFVPYPLSSPVLRRQALTTKNRIYPFLGSDGERNPGGNSKNKSALPFLAFQPEARISTSRGIMGVRREKVI